MKSHILSGLAIAAVAVGTTVAAQAADMPMRAPPVMRAVAPVMVPVFSWTGFYIGGNAGAVWGHFVRTNDAGTVLNDYRNTSWIAGGQAGYRWQFNNFVVGAEVSGEGTALDASALCPNPAFTCHTKASWLALAGGQLGVAVDRVLLYASGGYAATRTATSTVPVFAGFNSASNHNGWYAGAGIDFAVTPDWIVGVEYIHAGFQSTRYADPSLANAPYTVRPTMDLVRAKFSWKFGL